MSHPVQMPALGESVTEGTVTRWLRQEGDHVNEDEPLLEVSTDKVDTEVPAPYSGVLERILVHEDETVAVGATLAVIGDGSGASADAPAAVTQPEPADVVPAATAAAPSTPEPQSAPAPEPQPEPAAAAPAPTAGGGDAQGTEVLMPAMGESVTEGTVTRWLKHVGDTVAEDEPLLEISTDKVDTEVPSPVAGTLLQVLAAEDQTVEVGAPLAVIGRAGAGVGAVTAPGPVPTPVAEPVPAPAPAPVAEPAPAPAPEHAPEPEPVPEPEPEPGSAQEPTPAPAAVPAARSWQPPATQQAGTYVTPVVRKLAADSGIDLATVTGTGVGGRIRREDVLAAAEQQRAAAAAAAPPAVPTSGAPAQPGPAQPSSEAAALIGTTRPTPRIRQSIARNMVSALATSAQLTTVIEVDVTRVAALRSRAKASFEAREGVKLTFLPFFVKAAVEAAKAYPVINSSLSEDGKEITYHPAVNMGIAVDTPRGLIVPVIKGADDLNIGGLARRIADLADRTRESHIGPDELSGGTLSITNTGSVGALFDTAIFVPPQSAIVVTGAVVKRPVVVTDPDGNDVIAVRSMAFVALSYDHRTIDGADAARYLGAIRRRIEGGDFEADLGL